MNSDHRLYISITSSVQRKPKQETFASRKKGEIEVRKMFHSASNWDRPVHRRIEQIPTTRPRRKVISVPVNFVGSGVESSLKQEKQRIDPVTAAVRVQKAVRGFLVRKNVKLVRQLEVEVGIIEKRVEELKGIVGGDEKERLRVGEMLMSVLFRLDSVRGVRDYRKKVVRKAIRIQETLDCVADSSGEMKQVGNDRELKDATLTDSRAMEEENDESLGDSRALEEDRDECLGDPKASEEELGDSKAPEEKKVVYVNDSAAAMEEEKYEPLGDSMTSEGEIDNCLDDSRALEEEERQAKDEFLDSCRIVEEIPKHDLCSSDKFIGELTKTEGEHGSTAAIEQAQIKNPAELSSGCVVDSKEDDSGTEDEEKGVKDVMVRMVEENKKLHDMVEELLGKNSFQCMMLHDLSLRVDDLEKKMEKMGRKKKRQCVCKGSAQFKKNCNGKL